MLDSKIRSLMEDGKKGIASLLLAGLAWGMSPGMDSNSQALGMTPSSLMLVAAIQEEAASEEPAAPTAEATQETTETTPTPEAASSSTDEAAAGEGEASDAGPPASDSPTGAAAEGETEPPAAATLAAKSELSYTINTLVMFVCAVLVILMQGGFAMVEVGLNTSKNTVNILFKNLMDFSLGVLLFWLIGYGIMYPSDATPESWFGTPSLGITRDEGQPVDGVYKDWAPAVDFLFQVAFAATAATIVSGAVAGRMRFASYLIYSAIITAFVYPVSGMWMWGKGAIYGWGFADFAGSVLVHAVGGFAGLAGAIVLGPRIGRYSADGKSMPIPGHNLAFAALGVFLLWVGWYGFNPGSQFTYAGGVNAEITVFVAVTTTLAAGAGAVVATICSWILFKKPDLTMALNGALAGLVGITANCNQVDQVSSIIIGAVAGVIVILGILALDKLKIDDPVGAFPVHGLCGVWGGIATGIFGMNIPDAAEGSRMAYILIQLKGTVVICTWAFVTMFIVFMVLKIAGILRVSREEELEGLDMAEHGQHAYTHA